MNFTFHHRALRRLVAGAVLSLAAVGTASAEPLAALLGHTHVHGMSLDQKSAGRMILATHHGLYSVDLATLEAELVGSSTDDFMGYSPVRSRPGMAFASGHPKTGGNLGILKTEDGGVTWRMMSEGVAGPVDFHQMAASPADPDTLFGVQGGSVLQHSRDGGVSWVISGTVPPKIIALAGSAQDPLTVYAATEAGLSRSRDSGESWVPVLSSRGPVSMVDVGPDGVIHAYQLGRGLIRATEGTGTEELDWIDAGPPLEGSYLLYFVRDAGNAGRFFALTGEGAVIGSSDSGKSWSLIARP